MLAVDAVVFMVKVPVTVAFVPDAVLVNIKVADPAPPATASSSDSFNSIKVSMVVPVFLLLSRCSDAPRRYTDRIYLFTLRTS
jgi:hypothetical protein